MPVKVLTYILISTGHLGDGQKKLEQNYILCRQSLGNQLIKLIAYLQINVV